MPRRQQRRQFLKTSSVLGSGYFIANQTLGDDNASKSPNERIRVAAIGLGVRGETDSKEMSELGDIVAACDVDTELLNKVADKQFPKAKRFTDYRKMFDEMGKEFDAITVSTPDHTHAVIAIPAMRMGKHVFCQKPLAHSIWEVRQMSDVAKETKVATQMGNQGTALDELRRGAAMIREGVVGKVKEIHIWTNRPVWPQGIDRPESSEIPKTLDWDVWLGPAKNRPYAHEYDPKEFPRLKRPGVYHMFNWRGWWDFGTGALGDMACHTMNMPFMGLNLRNPISVSAEHTGHNKDSYPKGAIVTYEFDKTDQRPALTLKWYEGTMRPEPKLREGAGQEASGTLFIGDKGRMYSPGDYASVFKLFDGAKEIDVEFPKSPGHNQEWFRAMRGGEPAMSNFPGYACPLTEVVLLGNLSMWSGKKVEWDAANMRAKGAPELDELIKPRFREGWTL